MPKSKKRKKYAPRPRATQQNTPVITRPKESAATQIDNVSKPVQTAVAPPPSKLKPMAGKTHVIPQPANITTELKVMGVLTVVILIAIVALYFVFR